MNITSGEPSGIYNMPKDIEVRALKSLGLTTLQAKVYLAIVDLKDAKIGAISKEVQVARQDLYRITAELHKLGLVEKVLTTPVRYKATSVQEAVAILLHSIHKENAIREQNALLLVERYKENSGKQRPSESESQFVLVPEREAVVARRKKSIDNAECSIDVVNSWRRSMVWAQVYAEDVSKALSRGVKIKVVTQKPMEVNRVPDVLSGLRDQPGFEVRYILAHPSALVSIYDRKNVFIVVDESADLGKSPALWSNNRSLVALAKSYFDMLWRASTLEMKLEKSKNRHRCIRSTSSA